MKTVLDALKNFFDGQKFPHELREPFDAYWPAFSYQIRSTRNDVGHPVSVEPVTADTVHASLLIFPELAKIASSLSRWIEDEL